MIVPGPYFFHTCNYDSTGPLFLSYIHVIMKVPGPYFFHTMSYKFLHCYVYVRTMYIMCMYNVMYGTADGFCSASHVYIIISTKLRLGLQSRHRNSNSTLRPPPW